MAWERGAFGQSQLHPNHGDRLCLHDGEKSAAAHPQAHVKQRQSYFHRNLQPGSNEESLSPWQTSKYGVHPAYHFQDGRFEPGIEDHWPVSTFAGSAEGKSQEDTTREPGTGHRSPCAPSPYKTHHPSHLLTARLWGRGHSMQDLTLGSEDLPQERNIPIDSMQNTDCSWLLM